MLKVLLWICLLPGLLSSCQRQTGEDTLDILFTGDVLLDRGVRHEIERHGVEGLFEGVNEAFRQADAVVINLECPLTSRHTPVGKKFVFRAEPELAEGLRRAGVTHAALANNHTIDQGREGLADTYHALRKAGITPLGYGRTADEQAAPVVIRKGSLEVALFNTIPLPIENWPQAEGKPDICRVSVRRLAAAIRKYKAAHPGTRVVAVLHWGTEFQPVPDMQQRYDARLLAQAGADAIVGHHPHVPQPADSVGSVPVFYSLGNFVFDPIHPAAQKAAMTLLRFTPAGMEAETIPVEIRRCRPQMTRKTLSLHKISCTRQFMSKLTCHYHRVRHLFEVDDSVNRIIVGKEYH